VPDIFDEIQEDLRAERAQRLFKRYGWLIIVFAVAVVGGTAYWELHTRALAQADAAAANRYIAAINAIESGPAGAPHTAWQLLEHMRIAQNDILEFSRNPDHKSPPWPDGYWPSFDAPPDAKAWDATIKAFQKDARDLDELVQNARQDLFKPFAHGDGQTLLRQALLVATHNSYHLGQFMFLKKMLTAKT